MGECYVKVKQVNQICSPSEISESALNKAYVIEITKACTVAYMNARNSLVVWYREEYVNWGKKTKANKKKTEDDENLFFKASPDRFWLASKCCSWFKVFRGRRSIKWTSSKGNDTSLKVDQMYSFLRKSTRKWSLVNRWKKRDMIKLSMVFTFNFPIICYWRRICK